MAYITYYFDCSEGGPLDPDSKWDDDAYAFNGDEANGALCLAVGSVEANYLLGRGINSTNLARKIKSVQVRVKAMGGYFSTAVTHASVYTKGLAELLGDCFVSQWSSPPIWGAYVTLSTPPGGWTWAKLKALETKIYCSSGLTASVVMVQIKVDYYAIGEFPCYPSCLYPVLGLQVHGKIDQLWIHKEYRTYKVVAKLYYPEQPRTGKQQGWKSVFYDAVYNWRGFDSPTKNFYNQLTRPNVMSGYNRYLRLYLEANYPMVIYWGPLKQSVTENVTIPEYMEAHYGAGAEAFPVGSVFTSVVSTNPAILLGYGTWAAIAAGRVLVGLDAGDPNFDTVEETGGAKTSTPNAHSGATVSDHAAKNTNGADVGATQRGTTASTVTLKAHVHNIAAYVHTVGQAIAHAAMSIVQPYFVVYMWKRTA